MSNQASLGDISNSESSESGNSVDQNGYQEVRVGPKVWKLPEHWNTRELDPEDGLTSQLTDGSHYSPDQKPHHEYYYATVKDLTENGIDYSSCGKIDEEQYQKMVKGDCKPEKGDILFSKDGTVGITAVYEDDKDVVLLSSIAIIRKDSEELNSHFLKQFLSSGYTHSQIQSMKSGTAIRRVVLGDIKKFQIPLPLVDEQRWIASVLYNVDQAISKTEEIIEQTQRVKKGLMQDLFHNGIDHSEFQEIRRLGEVPKGWEVKNLGDVCERITDGTHQSPPTIEEGYPYITSQNIRNWGFDLSEMKYISEEDHERITSRCNPQKGDVLYVKDGANTGNVQVNTIDFEFSLLSSVALIRTEKQKLDPFFLEQLFKWDKFRNLVLSQMSGTGIRRLTISKLEKSDVLIPPMEEQKRIVEILETFDDQVANYNEELEQLQRLKKGLMQDLLTGSVRTGEDVRVLDEVVEVEG